MLLGALRWLARGPAARLVSWSARERPRMRPGPAEWISFPLLGRIERLGMGETRPYYEKSSAAATQQEGSPARSAKTGREARDAPPRRRSAPPVSPKFMLGLPKRSPAREWGRRRVRYQNSSAAAIPARKQAHRVSEDEDLSARAASAALRVIKKVAPPPSQQESSPTGSAKTGREASVPHSTLAAASRRRARTSRPERRADQQSLSVRGARARRGRGLLAWRGRRASALRDRLSGRGR